MFGFATRIFTRKSPKATRPAPLGQRLKARLRVEELMPRVLPNASPLSVVSGDLLIHGGHGNDLVSISVDSHNHAKLDVSYNHHAYQVNATGVHQIIFTENGGNDRLINKTGIMAQLTSGSGQDSGEGTGASLEATLANAGSATGKAEFNADGELDISVQGAAVSTTLNVMVDGNQVGTLTTDANGNGELELSQAGLVKTGSTIAVGDLTGTFAAPTTTGGDEGGDSGGSGDHGGEGAGTSLQAALTNAGGATGKAEFSSGDGDLEVQVQGAAASSTLNVLINGNQVGTITTDANGNGKLDLSGLTVNSGSTIAVGDLTGTFAAPVPEVHLSAQLTGASGLTGKAEFNSQDNELQVEISGAAANTVYNITIDNVVVGQVTTDASGQGEFHSSQSTTLTVNAGSAISVSDTAGNPAILQGTFATSSQCHGGD